MYFRKKAFTLIWTLIAVILYSILFGIIAYLYKMSTDYQRLSKNYTKWQMIRQYIENSDNLLCYKWWKNKVLTDEEKNFCDSLENNSNIKFFITTLTNIRDKKFYKTIWIVDDNWKEYLWLSLNDTNLTYTKNITNMVENYKTLEWKYFINMSIKLKWLPLRINLFLIDKNFLN